MERAGSRSPLIYSAVTPRYVFRRHPWASVNRAVVAWSDRRLLLPPSENLFVSACRSRRRKISNRREISIILVLLRSIRFFYFLC